MPLVSGEKKHCVIKCRKSSAYRSKGIEMITIKDIAKVAKVSVTTVSRALNNFDDVNVDTKIRIHQIAKELGYVPNKAAQNLVKPKSNTLAIILSGLEKEGGKDNIVYQLLAGMYQFAETVNYEVALFTTSSAHQKEKSYVQFCREHHIAGAVLNGIRLDDPYLNELVKSELPCVLIDIHNGSSHLSAVSISNSTAAEEAVNHLIASGHRQIAIMNGRKSAQVSIERLKGCISALNKARIPINEDYIVSGRFLEDEAYKAFISLYKRHPEITAIFCASDMMAIGVYKAAKSLGLKIPKDLSVVGFDNIPIAEHVSPPLTTVSQDFYLMGYEAAKQLLALIENQSENKYIVLPHKLLVRESVSLL